MIWRLLLLLLLPASAFAQVVGPTGGTATSAVNTAVTLVSSQSGFRLRITDVDCGRNDAGTSPVTITFNDSLSTVLVLPNAGNGAEILRTYVTPMIVAASTALTFTVSTATTTVYCTARGYAGP